MRGTSRPTVGLEALQRHLGALKPPQRPTARPRPRAGPLVEWWRSRARRA